MGSERRPTILLIEDNADEEAMIMRAVRASNIACQILVAHSTEEALDYLFCRGSFSETSVARPDVVVTDLKVGAGSGRDVIAAIRGCTDTKLIPIVVFSGSASDGEIADLYRWGANSFLEKPIDYYEFSQTIARLAKYWGTLNLIAGRKSSEYSYPYPL